MKDIEDRIDHYIRYIDRHPKMSGNAIYNEFKGTEYGIRRKDFYKIYRRVKGFKKPSDEKRISSVPKKYRAKIIKDIKYEEKIFKKQELTFEQKKEYSKFFDSLKTLVYDKMRRRPDNLNDLQFHMYKYRFRSTKDGYKEFPTQKQLNKAWYMLKKKGLTGR